MAMCGPKVIVEILNSTTLSSDNVGTTRGTSDPKVLVSISQVAGTDSRGTTLERMIKALEENGFEARAMELNAKDFYELKAPAIWLKGDHYVAITEAAYHKFKIYDPMTETREWIPAPKPTDPEIRATVLILIKK